MNAPPRGARPEVTLTRIRRSLPVVLCAFALGCGNPVGNPALEGFESDPRVVQGDWVTFHRQADGEVLRLPGELIPAGGRFIGSFQLHRFGRPWSVQFNDATWDGIRLRFTATMTIDGTTLPVQWTATFFPGAGGDRDRLLLSSDPFGGPALPVEYVRP